MIVQFKKLHPDAKTPSFAHPEDAGADIYALEEKTVQPGERCLVPTGIVAGLPVGYEIQVRPKSGLALKHGLTLANSPGTIDAGYRGELQILVINLGKEAYTIEKGKKVAQLIVKKVEQVQFEEVEELTDTARSEGGFGSTGLH